MFLEKLSNVIKKKDRYMCLSEKLGIVERNGLELEYMNIKDRHDIDIAFAAVCNNGLALKFVPRIIWDSELILTAVCNNGLALKYTWPNLRYHNIDYEFTDECTDSVTDDTRSYPKYMDDENVCLTAVRSNPNAYVYVSTRLKNSEEFILHTIGNCAELNNLKIIYYNIPSNFKNNTAFLLMAITMNEAVLPIIYNTIEYKTLLAMYQTEKHFVMDIVEKNGCVLRFLDDIFKKDKDVVLKAIYNTGISLKYADVNFLNNKQFVIIAFENNGLRCVEHINPRLLNDIDILTTICKNDINSNQIDRIYPYLKSNNLINNKEFILDVLKHNCNLVQVFLNNSLINTDSFISKLIYNNYKVWNELDTDNEFKYNLGIMLQLLKIISLNKILDSLDIKNMFEALLEIQNIIDVSTEDIKKNIKLQLVIVFLNIIKNSSNIDIAGQLINIGCSPYDASPFTGEIPMTILEETNNTNNMIILKLINKHLNK